jgi:hypothetical protein
MKKQLLKISLLLLIVFFIFGSCATATSVPRNATEAQLAEVNALNLEATAKNTSTLAGFQIVSVISGFLIGLLAPGFVL